MSNKTVKNVGIILSCSIVAKVLSYVWEATLAAFLGATDQADAFYMTTSIFNILYPILDLGIWKVFLPIYKTKLVKKEEDRAEQIANISISFFFMLSVALVLFLIIFARPLVGIMAPGFETEKKALTIQYLRISAPAYFLMTTASILGAILQSREKFLGSQIREIGSHVSRIACLFLCYRILGIYAALVALIVGSVFRVLIQLPFINWKWKFKPDFHFKDQDIVPMIKGLPSVAVTAAIAHINGLVDKIVASGAATGAVACLNYGHKLMNVFSGMISSAISTAVYPTMIQHITNNESDKLKELLRNVLGALMFFIIPISIFCFLFSTEMVTVAFQRGAFDVAATSLTSGVFVGYCLGMLFIGISTVVTNIFYGYGDTKITMYISIVNITLNIILNLVFVRIWGVIGLAYATSITSIICLGIRFHFLKKYIRIGYKAILKEALKISGISVVACVIPYVIFSYLIQINIYLTLLLCLILSVAIYFSMAFIFKIKTLNFVMTLVKKRLGRA
jgi:putative peptidoglycan lipid II flippase